MNIQQFHNEWLAQEYKTASIEGISDVTLEMLRAKKWWRWLLCKFSYKTKAAVKSIIGFNTLFGYPVTADEKRVAISYLEYIWSHNPSVDETVFDTESMEEIRHILRSKFQFVYKEHISWRELYPGKHLEDFYSAEKKHRQSIQKNGDRYTYNGFITTVPSFEYSVLQNNCSMNYVSDEAKKRIEDTLFVDCGAFVGDSAFIFEQFKPATIIALEPDKENFKALEQNNALNNLTNVVSICAGVGETTGSLKFASGGIGAHISETGDEEIQIVRIDDLKQKINSTKKIGLIKMDIEGHELHAIAGAEQTIREDKPVLLLAIYHSGRDFFEIPKRILEINPEYKMKIVSASILTPIYEKYLVAY